MYRIFMHLYRERLTECWQACAFRLKDNEGLLDIRDIPTRRHQGVLFMVPKSNYYKFPKNPYYRRMIEWNRLPINISRMMLKETFKTAIKATVLNPYDKVL